MSCHSAVRHRVRATAIDKMPKPKSNRLALRLLPLLSVLDLMGSKVDRGSFELDPHVGTLRATFASIATSSAGTVGTYRHAHERSHPCSMRKEAYCTSGAI